MDRNDPSVYAKTGALEILGDFAFTALIIYYLKKSYARKEKDEMRVESVNQEQTVNVDMA